MDLEPEGGEDGIKPSEGNKKKHKQQQKDDDVSNKATADTAEEGSDPGRAAEEAKALATLRRWVGWWLGRLVDGRDCGWSAVDGGWSSTLITALSYPDSTVTWAHTAEPSLLVLGRMLCRNFTSQLTQ